MINKYLNDEIIIEELVLFFDKANFTEEEIKNGGIVYTPIHICNKIIEKLNPKKNETIFEPSVGHGIFIFALLEYMEDKVDDLKDYFLTYVYGQDIEKKNIDEFKEIIVAFFKKREIDININEIENFKNGDTLKENTLYDIIFGNPPYIKIQNLSDDYAKDLRDNFESCEKGNIDIYFAFIEFAYKYGGRSSYIVPNSWLFTKSANILREMIKNKLYYVVDFKEEKIFKNVGIYTSIFYIGEKNTDTLNLEIYKENYILEKENLNEIMLKNNITYEKNVIKGYHTPIATLRDSIYIEDTSDSIPFFKLSKVKSEEEFLESIQKIIFPYDNNFKIRDDLNEDTIEYLKENQDELAKRDKGKKEYERWYSYGRRQGFSKYYYNNDIIIIPGMISEKYTFFKIDLKKVNQQFLFSSGFLLEVDKKDTNELLQFLNSDLFFKFIKDNGKIWSGKDKKYYSLTITKIKEVFNV